MAKQTTAKQIETIRHEDASRKNIPTAEFQTMLEKEQQTPLRAAYERRNRDLDPQLVWRGKEEQDQTDLTVAAPPLYIQEKVHPKALIDDLRRQSDRAAADAAPQTSMFADFNGLPSEAARTEFYQHDANWSNRMILGDSLRVMASLAEREGVRGKVQCVYFDPPYGIKFNSNFQWSTTSRDVKDGNPDHITREPEQVKAFRDTWRDGIHSYLTYLRDRLTVARELLVESGSVFVQIGDENVHRVRAVMDEVFGENNAVAQIFFKTTSNLGGSYLGGTGDFLIWYAKDIINLKYRKLFTPNGLEEDIGNRYTRVQTSELIRRPMNSEERKRNEDALLKVRVYRHDNLKSQSGGNTTGFDYIYEGITFKKGKGFWKTNIEGMNRLSKAWRLGYPTENSLSYVRFIDDFPVTPISDLWTDTQTGAFTDDKLYVVQTNTKVIERCILMTTDPGDLVLDPTCGSGTTAYVAEQWGRRWITIDTSRVALALARARIMGARYPYYLLADSRAGQLKDAELRRVAPSNAPTANNIRQGFVYERVPHITLKSIANNAEIDVIYEQYQAILDPLRQQINQALGTAYEEWEMPSSRLRSTNEAADIERSRDDAADVERSRDDAADVGRSRNAALLAEWWRQRMARQQAIDASIAAKAEYESLYDKPYEDSKTVRVAGPFTVESLSPHRVLGVDENDELIDPRKALPAEPRADFVQMILDSLKISGVQQAHKADKIAFVSLTPWPGDGAICAEGRYLEADTGKEQRAGIFIGPEFGTVTRADLMEAAREASEAGFDAVIACAFSYDAHAADAVKFGRMPVLKARMNADLHMSADLKNTGKGNLFVIFGEPDIELLPADNNQIRVKIHGIDVFHPTTGEVRSDGPDGIACWFIDTDYNQESFFVRHAYFLGANDPYKALKTTLKAEIDEDAWESLHSAISRPFAKPASGRIAVKVINHLGDEVMKVYKV